VLGTLSVSVLILTLITRDLTYFFLILLGALIVNGLLIDAFVNRVEDRLLEQMTDHFADVRHQYHQHGMVDEAIYEAAEISKYEMSLHAKKIYEILTANNPQEKLEAYYEVAPNRFLKVFAGISYLVKEYGDKILQNGSMYLQALNRLKNEIYLEILHRKKLSYRLKSLSIIAIAPMFFVKPIEEWAKNTFPSMSEFYTSRIGFIIKIFIFLTVVVAYILLRKMQDSDAGRYIPRSSKHTLSKALYKNRFVKWVVDRFVPASHSKEYFRLTKLLKETNSSLTLEWFQMRRIFLFAATLIASISIFAYLHVLTVNQVLSSSGNNQTIFGKVSPEDEKSARELTDFDKKVIEQIKGGGDDLVDKIAMEVIKLKGPDADPDEIKIAVDRIASKISVINNEYLKWWEVLISLVSALVAYHAPVWILYFQKRLRDMEMKLEVDQMHTIIAMLCEIERVSVETILEWMERYAVIFKGPLKKCLLNFESGPQAALEELKMDAPFTPFVRTIERLQASLERIPIKQAFDDLETDRNYYQEERKEEYERIVNEKGNWGLMLGFAPLQAVIYFYLVIPFMYVSINGMDKFYEQISKII
jgi:hypothetical protein